MRQWHLPTELLCNQHLLGEHVESHMFLGSIHKGISVDTYVRTRLFIPPTLISRHQLLEQEMLKRGMTHKSPLDVPYSFYQELFKLHHPEIGWSMYYNLADLCGRCPKCRARIEAAATDGKLHSLLETHYNQYISPFFIGTTYALCDQA